MIGQFQQSVFVRNDQREIAAVHGKERDGIEVTPCKKSLLYQEIGTDEHLISREGRDAAVGRIPIYRIGYGEGQDLPHVLPCTDKKIDKIAGAGSQVSDAVGRGKRRYMQKDSGPSS
jgi:hypothetical protein